MKRFSGFKGNFIRALYKPTDKNKEEKWVGWFATSGCSPHVICFAPQQDGRFNDPTWFEVPIEDVIKELKRKGYV